MAIVVGIPSALSKGAHSGLSDVTLNFSGLTMVGFMDIMDFVWGSFFIVIVSLFVCVYVGWIMGPSKIISELNEGSPFFTGTKVLGITPARLWTFFVRYVCPIVIIIVILNQFNIF